MSEVSTPSEIEIDPDASAITEEVGKALAPPPPKRVNSDGSAAEVSQAATRRLESMPP